MSERVVLKCGCHDGQLATVLGPALADPTNDDSPVWDGDGWLKDGVRIKLDVPDEWGQYMNIERSKLRSIAPPTPSAQSASSGKEQHRESD